MTGTPAYFFNTAPPMTPRLYFKQQNLWQLLLYGSLACPYLPQYTVFPGNGQVGRWTLSYDMDKRVFLADLLQARKYETLKRDLIAALPGMLMRYEDLETGVFKIWQLTDEVHERDNDNHLQLGVWPD